jgi:hypothetical protein
LLCNHEHRTFEAVVVEREFVRPSSEASSGEFEGAELAEPPQAEGVRRSRAPEQRRPGVSPSIELDERSEASEEKGAKRS